MATDLARSPRWRWAVPAVIVAAIAAIVGLRPVMADASPTLPPRTAAQLLAALPSAAEHPFSGTVETTARLGLPDLPTSVQGQHAPLSATSLLAGTHDLRVWYAGPDRQRVSLVVDLAESNVIHNGRDVWAWSSDSRSGVHLRLPADAPAPSPSAPPELPGDLTPQRLAEHLLAAVDPTTKVTVDGTASVAGRDAYELVVQPRDDRSLIDQIRLAVDADTSLPLRLQVFGTGSSDAAFESGFTSISYGTPSDDVFRKPSGTLKQLTPPEHGDLPRFSPSDLPRVHGSGWTTVLELRQLPDPSALTGGQGQIQPRPQGKGDTDGDGSQPAGPTDGGQPNIPPPDDTLRPMQPPSGGGHSGGQDGTDGASADQLLQTLLRAATPVSGDFGSGRLLRTALVSVLLLDDGRVFVGAVTPALLQQVAASARS